MNVRRATLAVSIALVAVLAWSVVALAAQPLAPASAPLAVPASETALITATGTAFIPSTSTDFVVSPQTLFISAQSKATMADVDGAVTEMQQRLLQIRAALERVGIPATGIRFQTLSVQPLFAPPQPGQPSPVKRGNRFRSRS